MPTPTSNIKGLDLTNRNHRGIPRNSSVLTRSINVVVRGNVIGYIQSILPVEGRHMNKVWELGNEDMVELVPGSMDDGTIKVNRMLLYNSRILEVFDGKNGNHGNDTGPSYPVSLLDFNFPFDIYIYLNRYSNIADPKSSMETIRFEAYMGCWFKKLSYEVKAQDDFRIVEEVEIWYTYKTGKPLLKMEK